MTDPQEDKPCRDCGAPTQHATERCDDCRTPAGRLVTALLERGIKATDTGDAIRISGVRLTLVPGYDKDDPWGILGQPNGTDQTEEFADAIAAIVQAPGQRAESATLAAEVKRLRGIIDRAQDAVYAAAVVPLEHMEHNRRLVGNGHHVAQEIAADFGKWLVGGVHPLPDGVTS